MRATRITYVGELGWELYVPAEFAVGVYELLTAAGAEFGLVDAGYYTINSLRLEKAYRAFGSRADPGLQPGRGRPAVRLQAQDRHRLHRPRAAVEKARADGPRRKLVSLRARRSRGR